MGRRTKTRYDQSAAPTLFGRCAPDPRCPACGGDGWTLGADGAPVEPAVRCACTSIASGR